MNITRNVEAFRKELAKYESEQDKINELHYTDASQYAAEYYGDVFHETTRFDSDWGDY